MATDYLKTFTPGEKIKASETNANNQFLLRQINESASNLQLFLENEVEKLKGSFVLPGFIIALPHDILPTGYLKCDGSSLLREDYEELFDAIGTLYGSEDDYHFNLPDFQGVFLRGCGGNAEALGTLQESAAPEITGKVKTNYKNSSGCFSDESANDWGGGRSDNKQAGWRAFKASSCSEVYKEDIEEIRPDNYSVNWIIKY